MRPRSASLAAIALLAAGCGSDDSAPSPDGAARPATDLRVEMRPEGSAGPERVRRIECARLGGDAIDPTCRALGGLRPRDLGPVSPRIACIQIYGGPATARVTGWLRGQRVSATFDLADGCETERWRRNAELLGPPPRVRRRGLRKR